jgi:hypothetical protein
MELPFCGMAAASPLERRESISERPVEGRLLVIAVGSNSKRFWNHLELIWSRFWSSREFLLRPSERRLKKFDRIRTITSRVGNIYPTDGSEKSFKPQ